jgi:hypothetical protein
MRIAAAPLFQTTESNSECGLTGRFPSGRLKNHMTRLVIETAAIGGALAAAAVHSWQQRCNRGGIGMAQHEHQLSTTTDAGALVESDEHSLTVGPDGPILLQDHYLIEQMANFNRERIPERQPHAKGGGAFGHFEVTSDVAVGRDRHRSPGIMSAAEGPRLAFRAGRLTLCRAGGYVPAIGGPRGQ